MNVEQIMKKEVVVIGKDAAVIEAVEMIVEHHVGCVLVVEDSTAVGIVTERDILKKVIVLGKDPKTTFVVIDEVDTDNWGIGGQSVTELRKKSG